MNDISIRQGPTLNFIAPMFQKNFENRVIDLYQRVNRKDNMKMLLPHITDNLFDYIKLEQPVQFVGSRICYENEDDDYFQLHYGHLSESELYRFVKIGMEEQIRSKDLMYDDLLYEDIKIVLDFYRMSYVDIGFINEVRFFEHGDFYRNLPIRQVW
jgi:hypothetical protein